MTVEWIEPIFNRTSEDVLDAENNRDLINPIGAYNCIDLNRIENDTKYIAEDMLERKIIRQPLSLAIKLNWQIQEIPTREDMARIVQNVILLMSVSNPVVQNDFITIIDSTQFTYSLANAIERNLYIMKNQPDLPIQKWLLTIENGIITNEEGETGSSIYVAEEETVTIKGVPYGETAMYMVFNHWSGNTDDLQYVENTTKQETTYTMQYHEDEKYEVKLKANFDIRFPRTLTLHGGKIFDDIGGTTRQFFAGDKILILADLAAEGKVFYEWRGTQEGLDNLQSGIEPSTSWLTMPDCDVELTSFYINAGKHKVTVDGVLQGEYDYNESVTISAKSRGEKYTFSYWSGDTKYLDEVTSNSFKMPDEHVEFFSNWTYNYSYNNVTVINGTIDGKESAENLRELKSYPLVANVPENLGFDYWSREGVGSFWDSQESNTNFIVGDGDATITAHFTDLRNLTLENLDNLGQTTNQIVTQGKVMLVRTNELAGNYIFKNWTEDDIPVSTSYLYRFTMPEKDRILKANYRERYQVQIVINYGQHTEIITMQERSSKVITADSIPIPEGGYFVWISEGLYDISNSYSTSTTITAGSGKGSVTATFVERIYHNVTVNKGSGTGRYYEGQEVIIRGDQVPENYEFDHWEEDGNIVSFYQTYHFIMRSYDRTFTAIYKAIPFFTVTVINGQLDSEDSGKTTGTYIRNSSPTIIMNYAPEGMKFLQWEIIKGDENDVYQPLAEHTHIRNLTHDITVQATYYTPNPDIKYSLVVINKGGVKEIYNEPVGTQIPIFANPADEGYEFHWWTGDTQYVLDRYSDRTTVNMPAKNIELQAEYEREGYVTKYHVVIHGGEVFVPSDTSEGRWAIEGEFTEGTTTQIKAIDIPIGWRFKGWSGTEESMSVVNDLTLPETTIQIQNFDVDLTRDVVLKEKYALSVINGETSGEYSENEPVAVFFNLENTNTIHYEFIEWVGDEVASLKLFDGTSFDKLEPGTPDIPQIIRMPAKDITITGTYDTTYKLTVNEGTGTGFYKENEIIDVSANEPIEGKRFSHWIGDITYIDNPYNPNIKVTIPKAPINITAIYTNQNDRNNIGYASLDLYEETTTEISNINIIAGEINKGFMIIDVNGHIYIVTDVISTTVNITRLTTKNEGGNENGK